MGRLALALLVAALAFVRTAVGLEPATLVADINPLGSSSPAELTVVGRRVLFTAVDDAARGRELWGSDGTAAGTVLLRDVNTEPFRDSLIRQLTRFRGRLYFAAGSPFTSAPGGLWMSDGTPSGTAPVPLSPSTAGGLAADDGRLFFFSSDGDLADVCWLDDEAQPACAGTNLRLFGAPAVVAGGRLFFNAAIGIASVDSELWTSDGSAAGTHLVRDIRPGDRGSGPHFTTALGAAVFFVASDGEHGDALWRSDGSEAGTQALMIFESAPMELVAAGDQLFFVAGAAGDAALWVSDGTAAGTRMVRSVPSGSEGFYPIAALGRSALLIAARAHNAYELWISDGSALGTRRLRSFNDPRGVSPYGFTDVGGRLVFTACGAQGCEPWVTDGTVGGTQQLADVWPGSDSSYANDYALLGGRLLFGADGEGGAELWAIQLGSDCAGDCDGDGRTSIADLTVGIAIALGARPVADCRALDVDATGRVSIAELLGAVETSLAGCAAP